MAYGDAQIVPEVAEVLFPADSCIHLIQEICHFFLKTSVLSVSVRYFRSILYFPYSNPDFNLFYETSWFFLVKMVFRNQNHSTEVLTDFRNVAAVKASQGVV